MEKSWCMWWLVLLLNFCLISRPNDPLWRRDWRGCACRRSAVDTEKLSNAVLTFTFKFCKRSFTIITVLSCMSSYEFDQRTADPRIPTSTRCRTKRRPLLTKTRKISNAAKTAAQRRAHHWLPPILSPSLVGWAGDLPSPLWAGQACKHLTHWVETLPTSSPEQELQLCQSSAQELLIWLRTDRDKFALLLLIKKQSKNRNFRQIIYRLYQKIFRFSLPFWVGCNQI